MSIFWFNISLIPPTSECLRCSSLCGCSSGRGGSFFVFRARNLTVGQEAICRASSQSLETILLQKGTDLYSILELRPVPSI